MVKQDDLHSASLLGRASASRIWRTVVFSGAMLGAPLIASGEEPAVPKEPVAKQPKPVMKTPPPDASRPAPPPEVDTVESVTQLIADMEAKIKVAIEGAKAAKLAADEAVKKAKQTATEEAAKVTALKKEKVELDKRLRTAKAAEAKAKRDEAAAAKRPRVQEIRPVGRGFVLS